MLLDDKLILFDGTSDNIGASTDPVGDHIDIQGIGIETSDLAFFILIKTEMDSFTSIQFGVQVDSDPAFGSPTQLEGQITATLLPSSTAIPAGTLFRLPFLQRSRLDGAPAVPLERYATVNSIYGGSGASDEQLLIWAGRMRDIPVMPDNVS